MKIKQWCSIVLIALFLGACNHSAMIEEEKQRNKIDSIALENNKATESQLGTTQTMDNFVTDLYVGDFVAEKADEKKAPMLLNRITILLDSVKGNLLFGHSVVAGNKRPFTGTLEKEQQNYRAEVKEPGDNKYDGTFHFLIRRSEGILQGSWTANDKNLAVPVRTYTLKQTIFEYNPKQQGLQINSPVAVYNPATGEQFEGEQITSDAAKINASLEVLKESDVENMYKRDLEVMRNAIYARHGYSFKNREMRYFFDSQVDWYIPYSTNVTKDLTSIEKQNIELIKRYEDHATSYYDSFGR